MENQPQKYFDLHITGLGYLNRAREVSVRRGEPFLAVDISALHGSADNVEYTRFDCRVSGREAQRLVRRLMPAIESDKAVLVGFRLGDLYTDTFVYKTGDKAGEAGASLKARLLRISWAKVDGKTVYKAPGREADAPDTGETPSREAPAQA